MATYTNYYNLEKPSLGDIVDVTVINRNYDTIDEALNNSQTLASNIAESFNKIVSYPVGSYCIHNNMLYKCISQTTANVDFVPAQWIVCKVSDDLGGSEVVANPSGTATTSLTKLEVDGTIYGISGGGGGGSTVQVTQVVTSGTNIADITVDNVTTHLYSPTPTDVEANPSTTGSTDLTKLKVGSTTYNIPSGGSTVSVNQTLSSGTEIGGVVVNNVETKLYAPTPVNVVANPSETASTDLTKVTIGSTNYNIPVGSIVQANPTGTSGSNLTRIKIDGTDYNIPSGGGSGSTVTWNQIQATGTKIAEISIDGNSTDVYAPTGGGGSSTLSGLTDVNLSSPTNGQVLKYDSTNQEWVNANESGGGASSLSNLSDVTITNPIDNQDLSYDFTSSKWVNKTKQVSLTKAQYDALPSSKLTDGVCYYITDMNVIDGYTDLIDTLTAGQTSLTISSNLLTTDSTIDIYTSIFGVNPSNIVLTAGSITLTFEAQQSDMNVKVRVSTDYVQPINVSNGNVNENLSSSVTVTEVTE